MPESKSDHPSVPHGPSMSREDKRQKIRSFVSNQLKLLETERLAVTKQERLERQELGEEVAVEVVDVQKTKYDICGTSDFA